MKKTLTLALSLLGLVTALVLFPTEAKALSQAQNKRVTAHQAAEAGPQKRTGQQRTAKRDGRQEDKGTRGVGRSDTGAGRFRNNPDGNRDPESCVPVLDGSQKGRWRPDGQEREQSKLPQPGSFRTPKRDGTGRHRR
ncbi:MAG: hypothetical protein QM296_00430 [Bacillota bacterium]|nr:hypothetical protein [Bacillota bacterium]